MTNVAGTIWYDAKLLSLTDGLIKFFMKKSATFFKHNLIENERLMQDVAKY